MISESAPDDADLITGLDWCSRPSPPGVDDSLVSGDDFCGIVVGGGLSSSSEIENLGKISLSAGLRVRPSRRFVLGENSSVWVDGASVRVADDESADFVFTL